MSARPVPLPPPTLVALLLCDMVIDDKLTNKKSAIGLFNTIVASRLPRVIPHMVVLASLTEINGQTGIELRLVRDTDNHVLLRSRGNVEAPSPLATVELVFTLQGIQLPAAGAYGFELWGSGHLIGRRRFQVVQGPTAPEGAEGVDPDDPDEPGELA